MESKSRLIIGFVLLAAIVYVISLMVDVLLPYEGGGGHVWRALLAVIPPAAVYAYLAVRSLGGRKKAEEEEASFRDMTELRKTQEQLLHTQLLASLGEMTAGIAHEVNNPLGSILLYSELLMAGDAPPQMKRDLKVIHNEAKRAARIMTNLLVYSRRGKFQLRRLDLHKVLRKLIRMRQYTQRVQNIKLSAKLAEGPLYIKGDSSQLNQLFMNLVLNAEEALKASTGGEIIISTHREGGWARVSVADDGIGIAPENLKQVFYPFFTTRESGEGTGLGLSTCYGIVTDHKGLIRAENNKMGGATFTVELPLADTKLRSLPEEDRLASGAVA